MVNITLFSENMLMNVWMGVSAILFLFLMFLFLSWILSLLKDKRTIAKSYGGPISILIPCYNEEKNIYGCLESICGTGYAGKLIEVIVIDDGSSDGTVSIVGSFIKNNPDADLRVIRGKHEGKSAALNLGVKEARHDVIMTVDADVTIFEDTISKLSGPMHDSSVAATNAVAVIRKPKTMLDHFQMIEFCLNNLIRTSFSSLYDNSIWFFGAVACYRRSALDSVGGFKRDTLTEDMDICLEMYRKGYKIVTVRDAIIQTESMESLAELFSQRMRWYFGALQSLWKNRSLLWKNKGSPSVLFLFFNQIWWTFFAFVFFPMTAYQIWYWYPALGALEAAGYLFRWFSLLGPAYVLYKIPEWGINLLNIFGVSSGIITVVMSIGALRAFFGRFNILTAAALFFYFPYTIIQDAIIVSGVIKYAFSKKRFFKD